MDKVDLEQANNNNGSNELVSPDGTKMEISERESIRFEAHPNVIFAVKAEEKETGGGIILPEGYNKGDSPTPIAKILAVGENVAKQFEETNFDLEQGDLVYVDAQFMRFAKIDGVPGLILMADGILGKLPVEDQ